MLEITNGNINRVVEILTKSFDDNKSTNWAVKQDSKRVKRISYLMKYAYDICKAQNGAFISDDQNGAILYDFPITARYNFSRLIQDIKFIFKVIGPERLFKVLEREKYIKNLHPKEEYIYLWFLGVSPENQGNGTGSKMLNELTVLADKTSLSICLETSNPKNLELYKRFGFEIYHEWQSDFIGFPVWFMKRSKSNL